MRNMSKRKEFIVLLIFVFLTSLSLITLKNKVQAYEIEKEIIAEVAEETETLEDIVESNSMEIIKEDNKEDNTTAQAPVKLQVKGDSVAVLNIPSVGILAQIKNGTDETTLKKYVGKFNGSAMPGENGNFSACAHNNIYTELFRNLHKVKKGESIIVVTKTHEYTYKVESVNKIKPSQTEVLNEDYSKKEITLITCTDMAKNRIVVKGILVDSKVI